MDVQRRRALKTMLFGPGLLGLRAWVTGMPVALLAAAEANRGPAFLRAAAAASGAAAAQFVVFSTSSSGDPLNCNAPGCYDDPAITHSADPSMQGAPLALGASTARAAQVWSTLPSSVLGRTCFFHHATQTVVHPDQDKVLLLQGRVRDGEPLPSMLSKNLAAPLGTLRRAPIDFNSFSEGTIVCDGSLQPPLTPSSLASLLARPGDGLGDADLLRLRDSTVDALHAWVKGQGRAFQGNVIDQYVTSRAQVRSLQQGVLTSLAAIKGNDIAAQLQAALLLFQMKVTPVVLVSLNFGGDNHEDAGFAAETQAHKDAIAQIAQLDASIAQANLAGKVTFCAMNVFGRGLTRTDGRDHNDRHAVGLLVGANVRPCVVGGVGPSPGGGDYTAKAINSTSGAAATDGDVSVADSLASFGKTAAAAVGVAATDVDAQLREGTIVRGALLS